MDLHIATRSGGVVPVSADVPKTSPMIALTAGNEEILGDRKVIQIIPETLKKPEVLSQQLLGLREIDTQIVGRGMVRAIGFPAWPILQDPDNAQHALNLVADLEWARRQARGSVGKVADRFDEIATGLVNSAPHFVPTLFEELARIFDAAGSPKYAGRYFGKARQIERAYGLAIDPERQREVFLEFGKRGVITAKDLVSLASSCGSWFEDPHEAFQFFFELNVDRIKAGSPPYAMLVSNLVKLGKAARMKDVEVAIALHGEIIDASGMKDAPVKFRSALAKKLPLTTPENQDRVAQLFTQKPRNVDLDDWYTATKDAGLIPLLENDGDKFCRWIEGALEYVGWYGNADDAFIDFLLEHQDTLCGKEVTLSMRDLRLEVVAAVAATGCKLSLQNMDSIRHHHFAALASRRSQHKRKISLAPLFENEDVLEGFAHQWDLQTFVKELVYILRDHGGEKLIAYILRREQEILKSCRFIPELDSLRTTMERLRKVNLPEDLLEFSESVSQRDAAEIVVENLRAGLLTEFTWPEVERHVNEWLKRIKPGVDFGGKARFYPSYPGVVACFKNQAVAIEGEQTLREHTFDIKSRLLFAQYLGPNHDMLMCSCSSSNSQIITEWSSGEFVKVSIDDWWWWNTNAVYPTIPFHDARLGVKGMIRVDDSEVNIAVDESKRQMFSTSDGKVWRVDAASRQRALGATCYAVDPNTGASLAEDIPEYFNQAINHKEHIRVQDSTVLAVPDYFHNNDSIVPTHDGNLVAIACGDNTNDSTAHPADAFSVYLGDGTKYTSGFPVVGVVRGAGFTQLVSQSGSLYAPDVLGTKGKLADTLDCRGSRHWMHRIPWSVWINFRVRDAEASRRLREFTVEQARRLLDSVELSVQRKPKKSKLSNSHLGSYNSIDPSCQPDAPAMKIAAEVLGCDDPDLCASVVQVAITAKRIAVSLDSSRNYFEKKLALKRKEVAASISNPQPEARVEVQPEPVAVQQPSKRREFMAIREYEQLRRSINNVPGTRGKRWRWLQIIGREKPYIMWVNGIFAAPELREVVAELLKRSLDDGLLAPQWCQISLDWKNLARRYGKALVGMPCNFTDDCTGYLIGNRNSEMLFLVRGHVPETIEGEVVGGIASKAATYGMSTRVTEQQAREWLGQQQTLEDFDVDAWRSRMKPLVQAITDNCSLSETAAEVLLAGGYVPYFTLQDYYDRIHYPLYGEDPYTNGETLPANNDHVKAVLKKFKITIKTYQNALLELASLKSEIIELLLLAAFDNNAEVAAKFASMLPNTEKPISGEDMEILLGWNMNTCEDAVDILRRAASPLKPRLNLKHGAGYGRLVGILLWWATRASMSDPHRAFYADQLETLKALDTSKLGRERPTKLPLQGPYESNWDDDDHWYRNDGGDAVRGLQEGYFDAVISALRQPSEIDGCVFDPRVSAASVVQQVEKSLGLSNAGATYFLQVLCLVDCTDRNVKLWNGWKKRDLDNARAELVASNVVVEGKRSRAGRSVFLPSVWLEASTPNLPMESWKLEYYLVRYNSKAESIVPWCPPTLPLPELFAQAWKRYEDGDKPAMEELNTKKYRKRR